MPNLYRSQRRSGRLRFVERQLFSRHFVDYQLALGCAISLVQRRFHDLAKVRTRDFESEVHQWVDRILAACLIDDYC